jgi:CDP-glucose 4,6-dehydratase
LTQSEFGGVYAGRKVLVTGHTGFKGSWLCRWLLDLGADVTGMALAPDTSPALFDGLGLADHMDSRIGDVRDREFVSAVVSASGPDVVFHLAAQPLVRRSYAEPVYTFETNVIGTANVLEACRHSEARAVVNVTTDKVYDNAETGEPFAESEPLGGHDPYSASKACSEIVSMSYRASFFEPEGRVAHATARAGNVIGGGDWAEDRIVPDIVRAVSARKPVQVRNPMSVRPWQHVLDPLSGYLRLGQVLMESPADADRAYNFGPDPESSRTVAELVERAVEVWGSGEWAQPATEGQPHEAGMLRLDITKAGQELGWHPTWGFDEAVARTLDWYRRVLGGEDPKEVTEQDLKAFRQAR